MALNQDGGTLKVIRHDPIRDRRIKIALVVFVFAMGLLAYWYGGSNAHQLSDRLQLQNLSLEDRAKVLQKDNEVLRQRIAILESASKIDQEATSNVRALVRQLEEDKEQLKKKLTFYKSVMAPENLESGIRIAGLDLVAGKAADTYKIRLVVSQVARLNPFLKGQLFVSVSGMQGRKKETLSLLKLAGFKGKSTDLGFRYFQALPDDKGFLEFVLPKDFQPEKIHVAVRIQKGSVKNFDQIFDWNKELKIDVQEE